MICPYRKTLDRIIPLQPDGKLHTIPTKEVEGFEECLGKKCPLYYEDVTRPHCHRVDREKQLNG